MRYLAILCLLTAGYVFNAYSVDSTKDDKLKITVITDAGCDYCSIDQPKEKLLSALGPVLFDNVDYRSKAGKRLVEKYQIESLPYFIIPSSVKDNKAYQQIENAIRAGDGAYTLVPEASGVFMFLKRDYVPNEIDYFFDFYDRRTAGTFPVLREFCSQHNVKLNLHFIVPTVEVRGYPSQEIATALAVREVYPDRLLDYLQERINFIETIDCTTSLGKLGMDFKPVKDITDSQMAEKLLQSNEALIKELGITNGNAVLVNNRRLFMIFSVSKKDLAKILNKK